MVNITGIFAEFSRVFIGLDYLILVGLIGENTEKRGDTYACMANFKRSPNLIPVI